MGRLLTKSLSASLAIFMRLLMVIDPLLSTMKKKWKSEPELSDTCSGFSSETTLTVSYGSTGSKVGTSEACTATVSESGSLA